MRDFLGKDQHFNLDYYFILMDISLYIDGMIAKLYSKSKKPF